MVWTLDLKAKVSSMQALKRQQWMVAHMAVALGSIIQGISEAQESSAELKRLRAMHGHLRRTPESVGRATFGESVVLTVDKDRLEENVKDVKVRHACQIVEMMHESEVMKKNHTTVSHLNMMLANVRHELEEERAVFHAVQ
ncbi:regulator of Vps4 activity in the MVB pathway protein [Striga asiatica]|uniref:Regulator of Vps4 activity in the MVB pathway protein n=1 Tax=Striga asiatica TaxID=4170 RepID=A0A5A7QHM8_STRAF|nr:regulator of Vps4 activity in the MVB pathway protein [Striga asiatica]